MRWFYGLPRFVRDLIIFNSFIFMIRFILNYGLHIDFNIQGNTLMAANVGILIVNLLMYRINKIREEERNSKIKVNIKCPIFIFEYRHFTMLQIDYYKALHRIHYLS